MSHKTTNGEARRDREQQTIDVIAVADEAEREDLPEADERGWRRRSEDFVVTQTKIDADALGDRLNTLLVAFGESLKRAPASIADFQLAEVTVAIEVTASGKVALLGTGAEMAGKGGLTLKLARSAAAPGN